MQNQYNLVHRNDDALIDDLARDGIPYVPFFPLGGFTPLQSAGLSEVAQRLGATPMQVALAWLLRRSPNILLIPGTSSVGHLRDVAHCRANFLENTLGVAAGVRQQLEADSRRHAGLRLLSGRFVVIRRT